MLSSLSTPKPRAVPVAEEGGGADVGDGTVHLFLKHSIRVSVRTIGRGTLGLPNNGTTLQ
jgi:hypothetical protein